MHGTYCHGFAHVSQKSDSVATVLQVKRHILQVTTHQMAILLLFNKKTNITFQVLLLSNGCILSHTTDRGDLVNASMAICSQAML